MSVDDLRAKIFSSLDTTSEMIDVPEWGVKIKLKQPTVKQRAVLARHWIASGDPDVETIYPAMLISTCVDPDTDEPLFTDADIPALLERSGTVVERLVQAAMRVSGMTEDAVSRGKGSSSGTRTAAT